MRTYLDCYPCFLRQALDAARFAGADERGQKIVLDRVLDLLTRVAPACTPPEIGDRVHRIVRQQFDGGDPYAAVKTESTHQALALFPQLRALLADAEDALEVGVRLSIAGNIIDLAPGRQYDLWQEVQRVLGQPFAIDDLAAFRRALDRVDSVLFLADNAGETVFDRLLIEALDTAVIYAVKGGPVLNDATREDALAAGLDQVAEIFSTGSDAPGTILEYTSDEFRRLYAQAELVIAKGQANYETLSETGPKAFFLLQTKCPVIARDVGVPVGSIVLKQGGREVTQPVSQRRRGPMERSQDPEKRSIGRGSARPRDVP